MVKQNQLQQALNTFIDNELAPLANSMPPMKQFIYGVELGVLKRKCSTLVSNFMNSQGAKLLSIVDNDEVDVETLYKAFSEAMEKQGSIELMGVKFTNADINKLYQIIKEQYSYEAGY